MLLGLYILGVIFVLVRQQAGELSNERFASRFLSVEGFLDTSRGSKGIDGLMLLQGLEYLHGAGLASVLYAGPHNDFVRWTQRIGLVGMVAGFTPYAWAVLSAIRGCLQGIATPNTLLVLLTSLFLPFHSLFGYPRDDAYQAPYTLLALGLCMSAARHWYRTGADDRALI